MGANEDRAKLVWCLAGPGQPATISANGNSGGWAVTPPDSYGKSAVSLATITDIGLFVHVGGVSGTSPTLLVQLDLFDDQGNLYLQVAKTASITAAGSAAPVFVGLRGGTTGNYVVLTDWGRVSWTVGGTNPSFSGVEIALYGR